MSARLPHCQDSRQAAAAIYSVHLRHETQNVDELLQMNDEVFVAKGSLSYLSILWPPFEMGILWLSY